MLVSSADPATRKVLFDFLHARGVRLIWSDDFQAIGRVNASGVLIAVVAYSGFNGRTCCMHMAGDGNWINRELLYAAFAYPFTQLNLACVFGAVAGNNAKALKLDRHLGFQVGLRVPDGWADGIDLLMLTMGRDQCRYLRKQVEHEQQAA